MPLPRFHRLPDDEQRRIIEAARTVFAADGAEHASYNRIIAAAGISKSSAYNYFDGREDLLATVLDDVAGRLAATLGTWEPAPDPEAFWASMYRCGERLEAYVAEHPEDIALIDPAFLLRASGSVQGWITDVVDNGLAIGLITNTIDRDLLVGATAAVLRAVDAWGAAALRAGGEPDIEQAWMLVRNLWGAPAPPAEAGNRPPTGRVPPA